MEYELEVYPDIFNNKFIPFLHAKQPTQIFFGGSSAGKSIFVSDRCVLDVLQNNDNYLIARKVATSISSSVFNEVQKSIQKMNVFGLFNINKSTQTITCVNGYQILFKGLDDVEKLQSITPTKGVITVIWIEEATETNRDDIKKLSKRLRGIDLDSKQTIKRMIFTFNPILQSHWIYKEYFSNWQDDKDIYEDDKILIVKATYKDNKFLTKEDIERLENETDLYYYNVYTLGNWGMLGDVIFTNWSVIDFDHLVPTFDRIRHGLDFGFSVDPTAINKTYYHKAQKKLYIIDEIHQKKLTNQDIANLLKLRKDFIDTNNDNIICDSSEPKSIQELNNLGIGAIGAIKGKDSIEHGIQWLQQQNIIIHPRCVNTIQEFQCAQWETKKGEQTRKPVDKNNHHLDALRYAYEDEFLNCDIEIETGQNIGSLIEWAA